MERNYPTELENGIPSFKNLLVGKKAILPFYTPHVMEHMVNPLKAIFEWKRILKKGGIIICVLPWKQNTFDHRRPITSFDRILQFYKNDRPEGYGMDLLSPRNFRNLRLLQRRPCREYQTIYRKVSS
jgi:ubiquinone/menaquinone biosynthesis C-methylase UbiE